MENDGASWLEEREGATGATNYINLYIFVCRILYESNNLCIALDWGCTDNQCRGGGGDSRNRFGVTTVNLFSAFKCGKFDIINLCN